jgi:hypothetical protein
MHTAPRAAAWVAWAAWTCNYLPGRSRGGQWPDMTDYGQKRAGFGPLFFLPIVGAASGESRLLTLDNLPTKIRK